MRTLEKEIRSLQELKRLWQDLDEDAGIRIKANSKIFRNDTRIFLFFYDGKYWINISNVKSGQKECPVENKRELLFDIKNFERAWGAVVKLVDHPLRAWAY